MNTLVVCQCLQRRVVCGCSCSAVTLNRPETLLEDTRNAYPTSITTLTPTASSRCSVAPPPRSCHAAKPKQTSRARTNADGRAHPFQKCWRAPNPRNQRRIPQCDSSSSHDGLSCSRVGKHKQQQQQRRRRGMEWVGGTRNSSRCAAAGAGVGALPRWCGCSQGCGIRWQHQHRQVSSECSLCCLLAWHVWQQTIRHIPYFCCVPAQAVQLAPRAYDAGVWRVYDRGSAGIRCASVASTNQVCACPGACACVWGNSARTCLPVRSWADCQCQSRDKNHTACMCAASVCAGRSASGCTGCCTAWLS